MTQFRRRDIVRTLALAPLAGLPTSPWAQAGYPRMPIRMLVGFAAGGATDAFARVAAQQLGEKLGQTVIVENRPGAGGTLAAELAARAPADGYTLLVADVGPNAIAGSLYPKLGYNVATAFAPISYSIIIPVVLVVHPSVPANSLPELIALAKAKPGVLNFGSSGGGGVAHLAGEMLKIQAGVDIVHVPFKGGAPALAAVIGGDVQMMFVTVPTGSAHIKSGKVRAIAVGSEKRSPQLPQVPTMQEAGLPGFVADSWAGLVAPAGTPPDIVARLNREMQSILADKQVREKFAETGAQVVGGSAEEFRQFLANETRKYSEVVRISGAKAD